MKKTLSFKGCRNKMTEEKKIAGREIVGTVVSDKMDQTAVVKVEKRQKHAVYGKVIRKNKKYYAHNADNAAKVGDDVRIVESRTYSKTKKWKIVDIIKK